MEIKTPLTEYAAEQLWRDCIANGSEPLLSYRVTKLLLAVDAASRKQAQEERDREWREAFFCAHLHHHPYGDDGELQCASRRHPLLDIKRDEPAKVIGVTIASEIREAQEPLVEALRKAICDLDDALRSIRGYRFRGGMGANIASEDKFRCNPDRVAKRMEEYRAALKSAEQSSSVETGK